MRCALWLVLAGLAWPAWAQDPLAEVTVSISVLNEPIRAVIGALSQQTKIPMRVTDRVPDQPVVLDLRQQPVRKALDLLCRGANLRWPWSRAGVLVDILADQWVYLPELGRLPAVGVRVRSELLLKEVSFGFEEVPLRDVVTRLAAAAEIPIEVDPVVPTGLRLTGAFDATPLTRALAMLCAAAGLYVTPQPGNRLRIDTPERVVARRVGVDEPVVIERYPDDYRGPLGYLVEPALWTDPAAYGVSIVSGPRNEPRLQPKAP